MRDSTRRRRSSSSRSRRPASGETSQRIVLDRNLPSGDTLVETELHVAQPRLWELNEPNLYRVTARVSMSRLSLRERTQSFAERKATFDEHSVRCGFRDFTFENGYFRLNGRRLFLRCSHTGNHCPVGLQLPPDPDMLRRDLLNVKVMGFNAIRFISGVATRYQLDLCDEIGLMVYEEPYAAWCLRASPKMAERFDESLFGMIRRDRNHPSVVIWGLLNETHDGPVFRHAAAALPQAARTGRHADGHAQQRALGLEEQRCRRASRIERLAVLRARTSAPIRTSRTIPPPSPSRGWASSGHRASLHCIPARPVNAVSCAGPAPRRANTKSTPRSQASPGTRPPMSTCCTTASRCTTAASTSATMAAVPRSPAS